MYSLVATNESVEFFDDGDLQFQIRWDDIQRITAWKNFDPGYERFFVSIEIVPDRRFTMSQWTIYYVPAVGPDEEWTLWTDALVKYVPGFSVDAALGVLELPEFDEDDDESSNCVHLLIRDFQESAVVEWSELDLWVDSYYEKHIRSKKRRGKSNAGVTVFLNVYDALMETQNGGFQQYFGNSTANGLDALRTSLSEIGAKRALKIIESACKLFPKAMPGKTQRLRNEQIEALSASKLKNSRRSMISYQMW